MYISYIPACIYGWNSTHQKECMTHVCVYKKKIFEDCLRFWVLRLCLHVLICVRKLFVHHGLLGCIAALFVSQMVNDVNEWIGLLIPLGSMYLTSVDVPSTRFDVDYSCRIKRLSPSINLRKAHPKPRIQLVKIHRLIFFREKKRRNAAILYDPTDRPWTIPSGDANIKAKIWVPLGGYP